MSKYKIINSSIIYDVLITAHTHLLDLVIYYSIIRLYCLQPVVLGIILTQGMSQIRTLLSQVIKKRCQKHEMAIV